MDDSVLNKSPTSLFDRVGLPLLFLICAAISFGTIDYTLAKHFSETKLSGELRDFVDAAEHFGTPYGQILGLLCVAAATGWREPRVFRIFAGTCVAGLSANLIKLCIGRTRPRAFDFEQFQIMDSFTGLLPFHSGGSAIESFPSAHTASAFGFAAMLAWAYPRGKMVFIILGFLVGVHRITNSAHYPSDVFVGAAVGWSVGLWFTGTTWIAKKFDRLEQQVDLAEDAFSDELSHATESP